MLSELQQVFTFIFKSPRLMSAISILLLGLGLYGLTLIFGPAVYAEAQYQVKSLARELGSEEGDWRILVFPNIEFKMLPEKEIARHGIEIPKLFIREAVVPNVDPTDKDAYTPALKQGIAHAAGTGLPGDGQLGYYFAHSSDTSLEASRLNAVFYLLGKLEVDDEVYVWRDEKKYTYAVRESNVVSADDVSFLQPQASVETIVLQTCWPVGTSLKRLLVTAELISIN